MDGGAPPTGPMLQILLHAEASVPALRTVGHLPGMPRLLVALTQAVIDRMPVLRTAVAEEEEALAPLPVDLEMAAGKTANIFLGL